MSDAPARYVIAYDIADDRRRTRVHNYLNAFGVRAQFSVFLVDLREAKMLRLKQKLASMIEGEEDSVMVCRVGPASSITNKAFEYLGRDRPTPPSGPIII